MKAAYYSSYGPASVITYGDLPKPSLTGKDEVLVEVKYAGLNLVDAKIRAGNMTLMGKKNFPAIPGCDFAGVIHEKGADVSAFDVGDEVFGTLDPFKNVPGTCAQYLVINVISDKIAKKPSGMSFKDTAALGTAVGTAWATLTTQGGIPVKPVAGKTPTVVIIGASGGVGHVAVQLAAALGCKVLAVCSKRNEAWMRELGATAVLDYSSGPLANLFDQAGIEKYSLDLAVDLVGGDNYYNAVWPYLGAKGRYISIVGPIEHFGSRPNSTVEMVTFFAKLAFRMVFTTYRFMPGISASDFEASMQFAAEKKVRATIAAEYPLEKTADAHEELEKHRTAGRILVAIEQ